jgi:hypothetical protein
VQPTTYPTLTFRIHGGSGDDKPIRVFFQTENDGGDIGMFYLTATAGVWTPNHDPAVGDHPSRPHQLLELYNYSAADRLSGRDTPAQRPPTAGERLYSDDSDRGQHRPHAVQPIHARQQPAGLGWKLGA